MSIILNIPTKQNTKKFMEHRFGDPCILENDAFLNFLVRIMLKGKRNIVKNSELSPAYNETIKINIPFDTAKRFGTFLTNKQILTLNCVFESYKRTLMRQCIYTYYKQGFSQTESIRKVQQLFLETEDSKSFEAIRKDWQRNRKIYKNLG